MATKRRSQRPDVKPVPTTDPDPAASHAPRPSWIAQLARTTRLVATHRTPWSEFGGALLAELGQTLGASRVALFEFERARRMLALQRFEWCASDCRSRRELGAPEQFDIEQLGLQAWQESLADGRNVLSDSARLAAAAQRGLIAERTRSCSRLCSPARACGARCSSKCPKSGGVRIGLRERGLTVGDALAISLLREGSRSRTRAWRAASRTTCATCCRSPAVPSSCSRWG
jgi:hypothetical protein